MFDNMDNKELEQAKTLLRQCADPNKDVAMAAQKAFADALTVPLRQGVLVGDIISNIFVPTVFDPNARIEYPIDFYRPDNASQFVAYTMPNQGKIPQRTIEGDYVTVPTYDVANSIDWLLRYSKEARIDVVGRAMEVLEVGFTKKKNDDGWHTILAAAFDRNIVVNDANASAGQLTKRLLSLLKLVMRRNGGGNSASLNRAKLTDLYISPESMEDIRNWGIDQVDEFTRRDIYLADDVGTTSIFQVNITALDELGEGQEYQNYYQNIIAAGAANNGMAASDLELVIGLDNSKNDAFVMPVRDEIQIFEDETLRRERRMGFYSYCSYGVAVLNNVRTIIGSL